MKLETEPDREIEEESRPLATLRPAAKRVVATTRGAGGGAQKLGGFLRGAMATTVSTSFAIFGLVALQGMILARLLGPDARGEYGTIIFYTQTLTYLGMMGAQFAVARRAAKHPERRLELSRAVIRFGALSGLVTIGLVAILAFTTLPVDKRSLAPLCVLSALALPIEQIRLLLLAVDQGCGTFRRYNVVQLATGTVLPLLLIGLWLLEGGSVVTAALLTLVVPVFGLVLRLATDDIGLFRGGEASPSVPTLLKEGCPFLLSSAVGDIYSRLDAFLFIFLASFTAQGLYAAAVPAASLLAVAPDALALFSFNAASRAGARPSVRRLVRGGALAAGVQVATAGMMAIVVGPLITLVYGSEFAGATPFALALLPAQAAGGFAKVADGHLRGRGKVQVGIYARMAAAVLMVTMVLLTFHELREMSIPIAAALAHGFVAVTLAWSALADGLRPDLPEPAAGAP